MLSLNVGIGASRTQLETMMDSSMGSSLPRLSSSTLARGRQSRTMAKREESSTPRQLGVMLRPSSHCSKQ